VSKERNPLFQAMCDEILALISVSARLQEPSILEGLGPIRDALEKDALRIQVLATFGRSVVERIVNSICEKNGLPLKRHLATDIGTLQKAKLVAPWIITHFHTLRVHGNVTVHAPGTVSYQPSGLQDEDLFTVLVSLLRVLLFWDAFELGNP